GCEVSSGAPRTLRPRRSESRGRDRQRAAARRRPRRKTQTQTSAVSRAIPAEAGADGVCLARRKAQTDSGLQSRGVASRGGDQRPGDHRRIRLDDAPARRAERQGGRMEKSCPYRANSMSKKKVDRTSGGQKRKRIEVQPEAGPDAGRRKLILIGAGTLAATGLGAVGAYRAGWFGSSRSSSPLSSQ